MSKSFTFGSIITLLVALGLLFTFGYLATQVDPPAFDYVDPTMDRELIPLSEFNKIADSSASFLWGYRILDLTGQAFVIVAAVICCLALIKQTESKH
jgi:hypothetical protein